MFKKRGFVLVWSLILLTACSNKEAQKEIEDAIVKPTQAEEIEEEVEVELPYAAPFTGVGSEVEIKQRPILVTINNHPLARPQSGLAEADFVFEMMAEGNITRLLALYQSDIPETIGPVRSARDYFVTIAKGLDAFYIAHGYSPDAQKMLKAGVVDNINGMQYDGILFKRSKERKAPHNSYISKESIFAGAERVGASMEISKTPLLSFYDSAEEVEIANPVSHISIRYGKGENFHNEYSYLTEKGIYERKSAGVLTVDKESEEPVELSNVIFMEMPHSTIDHAGRQQVTLSGRGQAYLFQAGGMKVIEWENVDGILIPMENGVPVKLVKGKSWISFVPTNPGLENMVNFLP